MSEQRREAREVVMGVEYMLVSRRDWTAYDLGKGHWDDLPTGPSPSRWKGYPRTVATESAEDWADAVRAIMSPDHWHPDGANPNEYIERIAFETAMFCVVAGWDVELWSDAEDYPDEWFGADGKRIRPREIRSRYHA